MRQEAREAECDRIYERRYSSALKQWPSACPGSAESVVATQAQFSAAVDETVGRVKWLVSGAPPVVQPGQVILFNNCRLPLKFMSPTNPSTINGIVLDSGVANSFDISQFHQNSPNTILVAPQTTASQCLQAACQEWTAVQPNTTQRAGSMWESPNLVWSAYCQPTNAGANQCTDDSTATPCCGPRMNFDKTFGTHVELTPFGGTAHNQDFINLSTNYGSGPDSPPLICGPGVDPNNCVTVSANIFFNVSIKVDLGSGGECSCGDLGNRNELVCTDVSCTDAYRYPLDNKQCACSSGGERGYVVTYCPEGSPLPTLPGAL